MKDISENEALSNGVYTKHTDMENGEVRYRLIGSDNSSYIRTEAYENCWENSHYHKFCNESYIVQKGNIFFCELKDNKLVVRALSEGDMVVTTPFVAHNLFMCKGAVIHTVKFGKCEKDDWNCSEPLDLLTKNLSLEELKKFEKVFQGDNKDD